MLRRRAKTFLGAAAMALASVCTAAPSERLPDGFQGPFTFAVSESVALTADLKLPPPNVGKAPYPVVVLMHGGTGVHNTDIQYASDFAALGYAAVVVDSFGGRGFRPDSGSGAGASLRPTVRVV